MRFKNYDPGWIDKENKFYGADIISGVCNNIAIWLRRLNFL